MPRKKRGVQEQPRRAVEYLAERLAEELKSSRESGQPLIEEQEFRNGRIRVTVIWDQWERIPLEDRTAIILRAYQLAEGSAYRDKIALASGLTVPEAHAAGMLPFQILPALRDGDPVTPQQCRQAMVEEGASTLADPNRPQLRFATEDDAEAARKRLADRLPGSEPVWLVTGDAAGYAVGELEIDS